MPGDGPYLHTDGATLRDARGQPVRLSGINWFGLETCGFAPDGLGVRSWWDLLDQVRALGFNTIRLPFSDQLLDPASRPRWVDYARNPDLRGLSGLQVLDRIIQGAGQRGLRVVLDRHRPGCAAQAPLWYTPRYDERRWIADLVSLARRYRHQPAVIGIDLTNEPHDPATWGSGDPATDWRLAAERAGNAVLRVNPRLLIFVEGVESYHGDIYWWGGNLEGAARAPVRLLVPHRLVYEAHDYGPGVFWQGWFSAPDFPANLPTVWRRHWAYLEQRGTAPLLLGEFGGQGIVLPPASGYSTGLSQLNARSPADVTRADALWQTTLLRYLARTPDISFMYWSLTPDSDGTGGLLNWDWQTANSAKERLLSQLQGAPLPLPGARPAPAPQRALVSDNVTQDGKQQSLTLQIVNDGPRPLDLSRVELRYWMAASPQAGRTAVVDWASSGAHSVGAATGMLHGQAYIAFRFRASTPPALVAPYGGVATMRVRLYRPDWAPYTPDHDWSYAPTAVPVPEPHVTLTIAGHAVWGQAPLPLQAARLARTHPVGRA
jgi:endoglucanase